MHILGNTHLRGLRVKSVRWGCQGEADGQTQTQMGMCALEALDRRGNPGAHPFKYKTAQTYEPVLDGSLKV